MIEVGAGVEWVSRSVIEWGDAGRLATHGAQFSGRGRRLNGKVAPDREIAWQFGSPILGERKRRSR